MITVLDLDTRLDLSLLRKSFGILSAVMLFAIPMDFAVSSFHGRRNLVNAVSAIANSSHASFTESVSSYESSFDRSGLFGKVSNEGPVFLKSSIAELVKDYRLKGVVLLNEPEAILEDARTQRSIFLKVGDHLGELTVKEIKEGEVVLKYYGEEKILRIE